MRSALLLLALPSFAFAAKTPSLPADLDEFLGPPPPRFEQNYRKPARELKVALALLHEKKTEAAAKKLATLTNGELAEHALYELARAQQARKDYAKSATHLEKLLRAWPGSVYAERAKDLLESADCGQGLAQKQRALLERCLWRATWKEWASELEPQATALYELLKRGKDPLLEPFLAELIQALPGSSALRQKVAKDFPAEKLEKLATLARYRTKTAAAAGVKPVNPDLDLFDSAMKHVLNEEWSDANSALKRFPAEFPQSEHWDRAQYWIARTEEKLGNKEEAQRRYKQVLADNPFTYHGLQSAIAVKHDWAAALAVPSQPVQAKFTGAIVSRQSLSLWRLRALLEVGLLDVAREEARFLFAYKVSGSTIGQEDPRGALLMARLFGEAGLYMAAFSHAYGALSLEPALFDSAAAALIFPRPFTADFTAAAERTGVHSLLLLSVAKQESAFLPNAVSKADALGLMQLLLNTAREVSPDATREGMFDPGLNVIAGSLYLHKLLLRFEGNIALALAAYNAGPTRAASWQKDILEAPLMKKGFDPDAFIDSIPYSETRKYVANILRNFAWYKLLAKDATIGSIQELNFQWQKPASASPVTAKP